MNITLKQIETFVWLAALKNFRRVAEQMNTTQPNISSRISSFEEALNLRLFERDAGSVVLTDQGQSVLPLAERTLQAVQALLQAGDTTREQAVLRLGVAETVAQTWLHRFLKEISRRLPNVIVELTVDLTVNLQRNLLERTLDLAFLNGPISELSVTNLPLGTVPLLWVAAPQIAAKIPAGAKAEDLSGFPILTHAKNTRPYTEVVEYFRRNGVRLNRPISSSNLAACLNLALDGLGIATLPRQSVQRFLASGDLVTLKCGWVPSPMSFTASFVTSPPRQVVETAAALATEIADWNARET
ncbi:MAG: LysR family transcriptional regulator [Hyphomicrobiales bacterium]|nr:LysR family transcriptional regulator [Hyphomicrobiales bacterium]